MSYRLGLGGKWKRLVAEWLVSHVLRGRIESFLPPSEHMGDFKKLIVWREAHNLAIEIYKASRTFPSEERCGLTAQLRRSAGSIPANIAEGCGRNADRELRRFVRISIGSATELEYHLLLAREIGVLDSTAFRDLTRHTIQIQGMLVALERTLKRSTLPLAHSP
jgi:four helix bundle protein